MVKTTLFYFYSMKKELQLTSEDKVKIIDTTIPIQDYLPITISSLNKDLSNFDISSSIAWETYIDAFLKKNKATVAFGGYLEKRDIYKRSSHFNNDSNEERNIHLGIDLWCKAGTKVLAVSDGEIHSFKNNKNYGDYGPTIILKHVVNTVTFFSLYGHLSLESIQDIKEGQYIKKGEVIGYLGNNDVNGDYAPHLHFQLMKDIGNYKGDYPGVCSEKDIDFYKDNCINPNLLLKLPNEI